MSDEAIMEKILSETSVFEGKLVKVHKLDVTLPNGKAALREVVRHPGASAVVPVDEDGMVTLVKQFRAAVFLNVEKRPLSELVDMAMRGEISDGKTLVGILMAGRRLHREV